MVGTADPTYDKLVTWLESRPGFVSLLDIRDVPGAGRGLFAKRDIQPNEVLLNIPASALLNPVTLARSQHCSIPLHLFPSSSIPSSSSSSYPVSPPSKRLRSSKPSSTVTLDPPAPIVDEPHRLPRLNTTQLLTLHVALSVDERFNSDWSVFLATLPRSFRPWHPLTWLVPPSSKEGRNIEETAGWKWWKSLGDCLTADAKVKMGEVKEKWDSDHVVLRKVLSEEDAFVAVNVAKAITDEDLLWAWLTVNTRTVSIPLGLGEPTILFNHTFVPLLDMINHSSLPSSTVSLPTHTPSTHDPSTTSSTPGPRARTGPRGPTPFLVPGRIDIQILASDRGLKSGDQVFFPYGSHSNTSLFTDYGFHEVEAKGPWAEVDVGRRVESVWKENGGSEEKKEVLQAIGCCGHDTLRRHPEPHASHGLLMTLRVLFASPDRLASVHSGLVTFISPENEEKVRNTLLQICRDVVQDAPDGLVRLSTVEEQVGERDEGKEDAVKWVRLLWEEERDIATALIERIKAGQSLD